MSRKNKGFMLDVAYFTIFHSLLFRYHPHSLSHPSTPFHSVMDLFPLPLNNDALVLDGLLAELRKRFQDGLAIFNLPLTPDEHLLPLQQDQDLPPDEIPRLLLPEGSTPRPSFGLQSKRSVELSLPSILMSGSSRTVG